AEASPARMAAGVLLGRMGAGAEPQLKWSLNSRASWAADGRPILLFMQSGCRANSSVCAEHRRDEACAGVRQSQPPRLEHVTEQEKPRHRESVSKIIRAWLTFRIAEKGRQAQKLVVPGLACPVRDRPPA